MGKFKSKSGLRFTCREDAPVFDSRLEELLDDNDGDISNSHIVLFSIGLWAVVIAWLFLA